MRDTIGFQTSSGSKAKRQTIGEGRHFPERYSRPDAPFSRMLSLGCARSPIVVLFGLSGFLWRIGLNSSKLRPSCLLCSRNFSFHGRTHGTLFYRLGSRVGRWAEDTAKLFVQPLDLFFDRSGSLQLTRCKIEWIHNPSIIILSWELKSRI